MANITNLTQFLGDVADAIRTKTKNTDAIPAAEFDTQILSIQTGIDTSDATALADNIENGYTAYVQGQKIAGTVSTSLDTYITDGPSAVITDTGDALNVDRSYGKKVILKDTQYLRSVIPYNTLANIADITPEKILKGQTIFGVEGTASTGGGSSSDVPIKLFETKELMRADTTAEEEDLAVVYRSETQGWDGTSAISKLTFPKTVTLPSAMTGDCYGYADGNIWLDLSGFVSATGADFSIYGNDYYSIRYTSEDGLTYTRTDTFDETIVITDEPIEIRMYEYATVCGYFMLVEGSTFDGLYVYKNDVNPDYGYRFTKVETMINATTNPQADYAVKLTDLNTLEGTRIFAKLTPTKTVVGGIQIYEIAEAYYMSSYIGRMLNIRQEGDKYYFYVSSYASESTAPKLYHFDGTTTTELALNNYTETTTVCEIDITEWFFTSYYIFDGDTDGAAYFVFTTNDGTNKTLPYLTPAKVTYTDWWIAPTQLTVNNASELYPDKIAYGKSGVIKGDGSIYENLDIEKLDTAYMNGLADTATTKLSINTDIPFGVRIFEPTLDPLTNEDVSATHSMSYKNLLSEYSTDITGYILDYFIDVDNNKITTYKATALGVITEYTSDLDLNNVTTKTYSITSNEYAVAGKLVNDKFYLFTHVGGRTTSGNVYAKVLNMSTGTITSLGTVLSSVSYVSMCTAYDEISGLLYFAGGYKAHGWGTVNTNTNTLTNKGSISNSVNANIAMTAETEQYVFVAFNNTLSAYKKGSTTAITVMTNCRPEHIVYAEDDTNKYTFIYNYNDSKKYYSISPKDSTSFGTFTQVNWTLPSLRIDKINDVTYYFRGVSGYDVPINTQYNDGNVCYSLGANLFRREKYAECKYLITEDSIRVYSPDAYSGQNIRLYIARNIKMKDLQQFPQANDFIGYCYDEGTVIPLTQNYTDSIIRNRKSYDGTIAPKEYITAVKTTETILGEEE